MKIITTIAALLISAASLAQTSPTSTNSYGKTISTRRPSTATRGRRFHAVPMPIGSVTCLTQTLYTLFAMAN